MKEKFISVSFVSVFLLSAILATRFVTPVSANSEINEPVYSMIAKYYDNRKAVVTVTADDWNSSPENCFEDMCAMLSAKHIYFTGGIITSYISSPVWTQIQYWLNQGYLEAASHSRTHPHISYDDYDYEIGGSKDDIIGNLALPPLFSFDSNEYVYTWIEPYGESDGTVRQKLGFYKYLADRYTHSYDNFYATWDSANGLFDRIGVSVVLEDNKDPVSLNSIFDDVYNAGGIYHLFCHPRSIDWQLNQYADLHTSYISGRFDVWYVNFGLLHLYRWIATQSTVQMTSTGSGQDKIFKISISSMDRQNYGARYPVTYVFDIPSSWTSGYVHYRYQESDPWVLMKNKSPTDFFNGIDASRFDFANHKAYVSVAFGDVSNDIYLQIRSTQRRSGGGGGGGGSGGSGGGGRGGGNEPPKANFTYSPSAPTDMDTIRFIDESHDPDGSIASWLWDFGDGSNATEKNPPHQYVNNGNYAVTLIVTDDEGALGEIIKQITVLNAPPKADFTIISPPKAWVPGGIIEFRDRSFDLDGLIVSWRWEFGDGTISTDQNPTHKYEALDTYTIKLTITDDDGATDTTSKIYDPIPPTTINDYDGLWHTEDFTITLTATDDYSGIQAIYYKINDGPTQSVQADGQPHIIIEGSNKLEYWSVDRAGNEETHHMIDVKLDKTAPVADAGGDRSVAQNILVIFEASKSSDNVGTVSYEWDFGNGSKGTGLTVTHTYKEPGTYVVRLTVKDAADNKNTSSVSITVLKDTDGDRTPDTTDIDDDGDGMSDAWELSYGLNPLNATDRALDLDGDGLPNLKEYQQGTDPTSYFSPFPWWIIVVAAAFGAILIIAYAIALTFPAKSESP